MRKKIISGFVILLSLSTYAQNSSMKTLSLEDLSAFRPHAGNWQIVGDVMMNPKVDIHHEPAKPVEETEKKKKSKQEKAIPVETPKAVTFTAGKGILLNNNDETKKDNLVTVFEHGDLELELEVMLPKGSNSGLYLQGRCEVQLFDSWATHADLCDYVVKMIIFAIR